MSASKIQRRSGLKSWDKENMIKAVGSFFSVIFSNFSHYGLMYNYFSYSDKISYLIKLLAG